jgi:hypothetical protein
MTDQYTTKEVGELISKVLPEFETGIWWFIDDRGKLCTTDGLYETYATTFYPALTLSDGMRAIAELGKKQKFKEPYCKSGCGCLYPHGDGSHEYSCVWGYEDVNVEQKRYSLLDAYTADGDKMNGPNVSEFFHNLLEV